MVLNPENVSSSGSISGGGSSSTVPSIAFLKVQGSSLKPLLSSLVTQLKLSNNANAPTNISTLSGNSTALILSLASRPHP